MILSIHRIKVFEFFIISLIFIVFFQDLLCGVFNTKVFRVLDEFLLVLCIGIIFIDMLLKQRINLFTISVVFTFLYLVTISIIFGKQSSFINVFIQSLIHIKFFVFLIFFYFYANLGYETRFISILKYIVYFSLFGLLLELIFRKSFYDFLDLEYYLRPNAIKGKVVYGGFIKANFLSFLILIYYVIKSNININFSNKKFIFWFIVLFFFFMSVKSRTALIMLLITPLVRYKHFLLKPKYILSTCFGIVFSLLIIYYKTNFIEKTINNLSLFFTIDSYYIRGIMYCLSGKIFVDFFPIGTGAATFGTILSENSIVYEIYSVAHRSFFIDMNGVYDSNLASIIGEFGLIGLVLFLSLFMLLKRYPERIHYRNLFMNLNLVTVFYCLTTPILMNSYFALILAFGYVHIYKNNTLKK